MLRDVYLQKGSFSSQVQHCTPHVPGVENMSDASLLSVHGCRQGLHRTPGCCCSVAQQDSCRCLPASVSHSPVPCDTWDWSSRPGICVPLVLKSLLGAGAGGCICVLAQAQISAGCRVQGAGGCRSHPRLDPAAVKPTGLALDSIVSGGLNGSPGFCPAQFRGEATRVPSGGCSWAKASMLGKGSRFGAGYCPAQIQR